MEENVSPFVTLICTVVPCLAMLGILVGGIAFFMNRRKKANNKSTLPSVPHSQSSVNMAAPAYAAAPAGPAADPSTGAVAGSLRMPPAAAMGGQSKLAAASIGTAESPAASPVPSTDPSTSLRMPPAASPTPDMTSADLTPSEIVLLRGDAFAPSAGMMNSWKVIGTENKVSGPPLAMAAISAAFLALEQAGSVRLEDGRKKATLGLREVDTVHVIPLGTGPAWPAGSYEGRILSDAIRTPASKRANVRDLVFSVLEEDASVVWDWAVRVGHRGLAQRGLLDATVEKGFLKSGLTNYSIPVSTTAMLTSDKVAAVQSLLNECQRQRPELLKVLQKEIKSAFSARQESADLD